MDQAPFFVDLEVIRLSKYGIWYSDEVEISHEPTRRLFAKSLVKEGKEYLLKIGRESKKIIVEDTPYFVLSVKGTLEKGIVVVLNDESEEILNGATLEYSEESNQRGRLICKVKKEQEQARFLSEAYYYLLNYLQQDPDGYFLELQNTKSYISKAILTPSSKV